MCYKTLRTQHFYIAHPKEMYLKFINNDNKKKTIELILS